MFAEGWLIDTFIKSVHYYSPGRAYEDAMHCSNEWFIIIQQVTHVDIQCPVYLFSIVLPIWNSEINIQIDEY